MTDPKTLPLYNKPKEGKVNWRNVLSVQPSWVNRLALPAVLGGARPGEPWRALAAPCTPPAASVRGVLSPLRRQPAPPSQNGCAPFGRGSRILGWGERGWGASEEVRFSIP